MGLGKLFSSTLLRYPTVSKNVLCFIEKWAKQTFIPLIWFYMISHDDLNAFNLPCSVQITVKE